MSDESFQAPNSQGVLAGSGAMGDGFVPGGVLSGAGVFSGSDAPGNLAGGAVLEAPETQPASFLADSPGFTIPDSSFNLPDSGGIAVDLLDPPVLGSESPFAGFPMPSASPSGSLGTYLAGETIGGGRFVRFGNDEKIYKADGPGSLPAHGYLKQAVVIGAEVEVWQTGRLTGLAGLAPGEQYWLGTGGLPTNVIPLSGIHQPVGSAAEDTVLAVDIEPAITLT